MAFQFYIDGFLTDQPDNGTDLVTTIRRDSVLGGLVVTQDVLLSYTNNNNLDAGTISGYSYLKTQFDDSICNEVEFTVYDSDGNYLIFTGTIKLPQVKFNEQLVSLSTKVQDNSYYAYINNNKELKVDLRAIQTKSKIPLTPITVWEVNLFNSETGNYGSDVGIWYHGYEINEVFSFIVSAITDNKVSFQSDYLDGLEFDLFLIKGQELLNPFSIFPGAETPVYEISFADLFRELNVAKNLYFYIDSTDPDAPILRIENTEATYSNTELVTLAASTGVKDIITSTDLSKLYGQVVVGSEVTADGQDPTIYTFNEATSYYGWKKEFFYPLGQCNTNAELNLVNKWVLSNNAIMDVIVGGSTSTIDDYFLIECNELLITDTFATAHRYDYFGQATPPFFYNFGLNNYAKMQRHSDKFETAFGNFLGIGGTGFRALLGDNPLQDITYVTAPASNLNFIPLTGLAVDAEYVNETTEGGYDGSNNYDNVTFEYTVPADGDYSFRHQLSIEIANIVAAEYFNIIPYVSQYDSTVTVLKSQGFGGGAYGNNGFFVIDATLVCNCLAGDVIKGGYNIGYEVNGAPNQQNSRNLTVQWDSFLECNGTPEGGISITSGNKSIKKLLHEMQYDFTQTEIRTIRANPTGIIKFEKDDVVREAWIEEMQINNWTGRTRIKLISSNATV